MAGKVERHMSGTGGERRPRVDAYGAAEYIGHISHWTIRAKAYNGEIPSIKQGGRLLFELAALDDYIARNTRPLVVRGRKAPGTREAAS